VREVYPIGGVPQEFRKDNLYVLISGNILECERVNSCIPPPPYNGKQGTDMFELKSIKINEQGECSWWDTSNIIAILQDEPAYLRKGCFEESDLFYIELVNEPKINHYVSMRIYPCNGVPEEFQIDGLSVLVSGNILREGKGNMCTPSMPNAKLLPDNIFELKSMKINIK
jgi:hypothetical protein